jgi:hypothetical protein
MAELWRDRESRIVRNLLSKRMSSRRSWADAALVRVRGAATTDMAVGAKLVGNGTVPCMLGRLAMDSRDRMARGSETSPLKGVAIGPAITNKGSVKAPSSLQMRSTKRDAPKEEPWWAA